MNGGLFPELDEASVAQLQMAMADGRLTAQALVEMFLARIEAPVRETAASDGLGPVISGAAGAHSHGAIRHSHDRLAGPHLHCMHCGSDSRLCLDNLHHAEGPIPVRESNAQAEPNAFVGAVNAMLDGRRSPVTTGRARALLWQQEQAQAGHSRTGQGGKGEGAAWERAVFG